MCRITIGASTSPQRLGITRAASKSERSELWTLTLFKWRGDNDCCCRVIIRENLFVEKIAHISKSVADRRVVSPSKDTRFQKVYDSDKIADRGRIPRCFPIPFLAPSVASRGDDQRTDSDPQTRSLGPGRIYAGSSCQTQPTKPLPGLLFAYYPTIPHEPG